TTPDFHKVRALLAILDKEEPSTAIIFCNTREDTATVATFLSRQGLDAELLSGELPQNKRSQVMDRVKRGETQFLVATDVAARGIDISDLSHVVNYSLPEDPAVYMHRTGRTGRAGKDGIAISLAGGMDMSTRDVLEQQYEIPWEHRPLPTAEEAASSRVERQANAIRTAMGTMAFEGYLGTVRAIKERPDGDLLLAAALRAFFLWDRMRKAQDSQTADSIGALQRSREEKREGRDGGRRRGRRDGGSDRGRSDGGGGGGGGGRGGRPRRRRRGRGKGPGGS
ncbi:MAG: C-terminal helicase domain-containing protein, partial [Myxococcota bacterium]|nr:C-terminal helicase domain-containing protein [Myxococcota bacterium]